MKPWLSLLLSASIAVGVVAVYDQLRRDQTPDRVDVVIDAPSDASLLEERVAALEAEEEPLLTGRGDAVLVARIENLERRLRALESSVPEVAPPADPVETAAEAQTGEKGHALVGGPSPEAVDEFRKLRGAAQREDRRRYRRKQVAVAIEKLDFAVTDRQREQLAETLEAFQPRLNEIWGEAKNQPAGADVDWPRVIEATQVRLQSEFADRISEIVPHRGDAEQLSSVLVGAGAK